MTRYSHLRWLAPLGGLLATSVLAVSAVPTGATIVCPNGIKPPSPYCTNVPPTATTLRATKVTGTTAQLNGIAGPDVRGGDITKYFFQWGMTTAYDRQTPEGTIGSCPHGISPPSPYCNVPKKKRVSADIFHLTPCTTYHFRIVAQNPDGMTTGADRSFTTKFATPLTTVNSPARANPGSNVRVRFTLRYAANPVEISIEQRNGTVVASYNYGSLSPGTYTETVTAPTSAGNYRVVVTATLTCGQQSVANSLKVH